MLDAFDSIIDYIWLIIMLNLFVAIRPVLPF